MEEFELVPCAGNCLRWNRWYDKWGHPCDHPSEEQLIPSLEEDRGTQNYRCSLMNWRRTSLSPLYTEASLHLLCREEGCKLNSVRSAGASWGQDHFSQGDGVWGWATQEEGCVGIPSNCLSRMPINVFNTKCLRRAAEVCWGGLEEGGVSSGRSYLLEVSMQLNLCLSPGWENRASWKRCRMFIGAIPGAPIESTPAKVVGFIRML